MNIRFTSGDCFWLAAVTALLTGWGLNHLASRHADKLTNEIIMADLDRTQVRPSSSLESLPSPEQWNEITLRAHRRSEDANPAPNRVDLHTFQIPSSDSKSNASGTVLGTYIDDLKWQQKIDQATRAESFDEIIFTGRPVATPGN